ncbi:MAG: GNAT family N-acetyltransferase [Prevotellaceae bacterium]|jgi:ribosomal protein S18 acetylase RimI-like enzyme|nr:GNAT family N-acetyltransferase [Prevotellaceae bacterium]
MNDLSNRFYIAEMQTCEVKEVANLLTDAFETNPAYSLIFHKNDLREGLLWLFRTNLVLLNRRQRLTRVVKEKKSGDIVGTFTLLPPEGVKRTLGDYLRVNLFEFIYRFGFYALYRMVGLDGCNKTILHEAMKSTKYYYLSMVVVNAAYRGKGLGSFAVGSCLDELRTTENQCHLLGLTTQLQENVSFYSRLGFEVINEGKVVFGKNRYYNWNMKCTI